MPVKFLKPKGLNVARAAERAYGYGVRSDNLVFTSGQVGRDVDGRLVGGDDAEKQAEQAFANMALVLESAGGSLADVITIRTYTTSRAHLPKILAARKRCFPGPDYPTNAVLIVSELSSPEYLVELEAIARIKPKRKRTSKR
jgi:2-iminobutanoate/2-iminopropanoate deaminase